jgi:uncharacterized surface protein with fasciclin (FAS1) repeats
MKYFFKNITKISLATILGVALFTSCNKRLEDAIPITTTFNSLTIGNFLNTDTAYTFFNAAVKASPFSAALYDSSATTSYTVFAPNNNAFRAIGVTTTAAAATLQGIVGYLIVPGREFVFSDIPTTFPNIQLPSSLTIGLLPGTTIPVKLTNFPSRRATGAWLNTAPITSFDVHYRNGVVHAISSVVTPPSQLMAQIIYSDPQFTMFDSLIARGDLGQPNAALKVDSIMKNAGANLTFFAPTNTAVKAFITAASGGAIPSAAPDAIFFGFINSSLPIASAQGIVLYHFMGVRAFGVNFSSTPAFYPTLLNGGIPTHPGVNVQSFFKTGGLIVDSMKVVGVANGGLVATAKPATNFDKLAVNGVVHIIDRLLLPQ